MSGAVTDAAAPLGWLVGRHRDDLKDRQPAVIPVVSLADEAAEVDQARRPRPGGTVKGDLGRARHGHLLWVRPRGIPRCATSVGSAPRSGSLLMSTNRGGGDDDDLQVYPLQGVAQPGTCEGPERYALKWEQITTENHSDAPLEASDRVYTYYDWLMEEAKRLRIGSYFSEVAIRNVGLGKVALLGIAKQKPIEAPARRAGAKS